MRKVLTAVVAALGLSASAFAVPPDVMTAYRAYLVAIETGDFDGAAVHAEAAYTAGVAAQIDAETLAALAQNRAQTYSDLHDFTRAGPAWDDAITSMREAGLRGAELDDALYLAASAYFAQGQLAQAAPRAASYTGVFGSAAATERLFVMYYIQALAEWEQRELRDAGTLARQALDVREQLGPSVTPGTMTMAKMVAIGVSLRRNTRDAAFYLTLSTDISEALGRVDPEHEAMSAWARYLRRQMNQRERELLFERIAASPLFDFDIPERDTPYTEREEGWVDAYPRNRASPDYPPEALDRGMEGIVMVRFDVDERGRPENINIVFSLPVTNFGEAAEAAVRRWRYQPATINDNPVRREGVQTTFEFVLD